MGMRVYECMGVGVCARLLSRPDSDGEGKDEIERIMRLGLVCIYVCV